MKQLQALIGHTYGPKFRNPGDVYEASDQDAKLMVLLKRSIYYEAPVVPVAAPVVEAEEQKPKRTYTRRSITNPQNKALTAE